MPRYYAIHDPRFIREHDECGLHEAKFKHEVSKLLDTIENADDIKTLRMALSKYITIQTGVL